MDSRETMEGGEERGSAGNVVRLPRDWLGPREELVPIGPRARPADQPDDDPAESRPPTAASFWDEDSGALQAPMQAPTEAWRGQWAPGTPSPPAPPPPRSRRRTIPRPRIRERFSDRFVPRRWVGAAIGSLALCALLVLAVIGRIEGGSHKAAEQAASLVTNSPIVAATGVNLARSKPHIRVVTKIKTHRATTSRSHRRATRHHRIRVTRLRPHHHLNVAAQPTHSTSEPVHTTPSTTLAPVRSAPTTTAPRSTGPSSPPPAATTGPSTGSSGHHHSAFGPSGSLGPGSSPDS